MATTTDTKSTEELLAEAADLAMTRFALAMDAYVAADMDTADVEHVRKIAVFVWDLVYGKGGEREAEAIENLAWDEADFDL